MASNHYRQSAFAKPLWLAMAVFFLVFSSCPVRKYIRLQLYKHNPITETSATADHFKIKDIKDCTIAEKLEHGVNIITSVVPSDGNDLVPFFFYSALSFAALLFVRRNKQRLVLFKPLAPVLQPIPLYLRVRHLQI